VLVDPKAIWSDAKQALSGFEEHLAAQSKT